MEDVPTKTTPTDFSLCIRCQERVKKQALTKPKNESSYETFLSSVNKRCQLGNPDFLNVSNRLKGYTSSDLLQCNAQWHRTCYSDTTHKINIERDATRLANVPEPDRKGKGRPSIDPLSPRSSRSSVEQFDRSLCFFCHQRESNKSGETLHRCRSENIGVSIGDIVERSGNNTWLIQLKDCIKKHDLHARDIVYHNSCKTTNWEKFVQRPERSSHLSSGTDISSPEIAAEIEFYNELGERLDAGEYLTTVQVEQLYKNMLLDHGVVGVRLARRTLMQRIIQQLPFVVISPNRGSQPGLLHSKKAGRTAVDTALAEKDRRGDLNAIFKCAKIIRRVISTARKDDRWSFTGTLDDLSENTIPEELMIMNRWILQGAKAAPTQSRDKTLRRSCAIISQTMMQEFKTDRQVAHVTQSTVFRRQVESPFAVGMSLWMYHTLRSQKAITVLNKCGAGISYDRVTHVCSQIANAVLGNINANCVFVPPALVKGCAIRASCDNIDKKVDTRDGKNSFHAMASAVYQSPCENKPVVEPLNLYRVPAEGLVGVPSTCIRLARCDITGSPKPRTSPTYMSYRVGIHQTIFEKSLNNDLVWLLARHHNRSINGSIVHSPQVPQSTYVTDVTNVASESLAVNDLPFNSSVQRHGEALLMPDNTGVEIDDKQSRAVTSGMNTDNSPHEHMPSRAVTSGMDTDNFRREQIPSRAVTSGMNSGMNTDNSPHEHMPSRAVTSGMDTNIYDCIGANRAKALCKWHALTGCDTTGHIKGKSKKGCLDAFLKASPDIVSSISGLGVGNEPSAHTVDGCISYLCALFCKKGIDITKPSSLRWMLFKQLGTEKGIDNLPPTHGAWMEHVRRAHCQASLWEQDLCLDPVVPDPVDIGWRKENGHLIPGLSKLAPAPAAVVELVRCRCGATATDVTLKCVSARCSCRVKDLPCTELCLCAAAEECCQNVNMHHDVEDTM